MKNLLKYSLVAAVMFAGASSLAHANGYNPPPKQSAPEVDPGMAMSGLTLLAGTLTILRAKRSK